MPRQTNECRSLSLFFFPTVDSIFSLEKQDDQTQVSSPYNVTVVMRASSLVGGNLTHADGLGATVDHLRAYFQQSKIQSVQIIILTKSLDDTGSNIPELVTSLQTVLQQKLDVSSGTPAEAKQSGNAGLPMVVSVSHVQESRVGYRKLARQVSLSESMSFVRPRKSEST